jgi:N-acetylglucosaminyldiphosphoundecaprenol N-acetyl-beta-D-mannosaminyltransferase
MPGSNPDPQRAAEIQAMRRELLHELDEALSATGIRHRKRAHLRRSLGWMLAERTASGLRRTLDFLLAFLLFVLLSPVLLLATLLAQLGGGGIVKRQRLGRWATRFYAYHIYFPKGTFGAHFAFLSQLPSLLNVLKGDMSFIGPRPIAPGEELAEKRIAWKRYNLRPGLLSLWWIRKRANIAHTSEVSLDLEYVETQNFWGDLGIAARAIPAALYGTGSSNAPPQISFLGVRIDNFTMAEASTQIVALTSAAESSQVSFVNADCVNIACKDADYRAVLSRSRLVLADGIGVRLAGAILNQNVRENVNGTDMLPYLCAALEQANLGIYLLGGKPGVAEDVAKWIAEHFPALAISGHRDGFFTSEQQPEVASAIEQSGASIVLVALGCPRQEKWIAEWIDRSAAKNSSEISSTTAKVLIGVGGLFDFYSGRIPRAPVWIRELGMEWLYRFSQEPGRMWRRYFVGNFKFLYRVMGERFRMRSAQRAEGNTR